MEHLLGIGGSTPTSAAHVQRQCPHGHGLLVRKTSLMELTQRPIQEQLQREVLVEPVVRAAAVLEVVRTNLLGARPRADLVLAQAVLRGLLFLEFGVVQARPQQGQRDRLVLQLRALLLTENANPCARKQRMLTTKLSTAHEP
jgi:hypothetical protein